MIAVSLVNIAIWTQLAVPCAHNIDWQRAARLVRGCTAQFATALAPKREVEKIVIRETTLSEKLGLGLEPVEKPDPAIESLRSESSRFSASICWRPAVKDKTWDTPNMHETTWYHNDWDKKFDIRWDDDGSFWSGDKHFAKRTFRGGGLDLSMEFDR